jgi:glycosyltransferase involved in cell wall biosynthesis
LGLYYRLGRVLFAPNRELIDYLRRETGRPVFHMPRGIDSQLFTPRRRTRRGGPFRVGYVGRLSPEKHVRALARLEERLARAGVAEYEIEVVGAGVERAWLEARLRRATFRGVLVGEDLAAAYADFDVFVFPSRTDTFGNVVLEAQASGVPVVVTADGGPKYLVREGLTGFVARTDEALADHVLALYLTPSLRGRMGAEARRHAAAADWDAVFEGVYEGYRRAGDGWRGSAS